MRRLAFAALVLLLALGSSSADEVDARVDRVEQWLKAITHHVPGTADDPAALVASWPTGEIRTLWIDANVLVQLTRNLKGIGFSVRPEGQTRLQSIRYLPSQMRRLRSLACAAGGRLSEPVCANSTEIDSDLAHLSVLAAAARLHGDNNFVLRRGALLHADIAMLIQPANEPVGPTTASIGPQRVRLHINDGREIDLGQVATHWELARMLLDYVIPKGADRPAPGRDTMVRDWYRATAAWMQQREDHDTVHLNRARDIFPNDPHILFLSGCQRETYASPAVQAAMQTLTIVPFGMKFDVQGGSTELRHAEEFFRRSVAAAPELAEARLRFGHVLLLLDRPADAAAELRLALAAIDDDVLRYYGELFLGQAEEAAGNMDGARGEYTAAQHLYPNAQSPALALSALARRLGDRATAVRELHRIFDSPLENSDSDDPWWTYYVAQARNTDELLEALWRPFVAAGGKP